MSEQRGIRTISRWECPACGKRENTCECDYQGGSVQVWYVEKGDHLAALHRLESQLSESLAREQRLREVLGNRVVPQLLRLRHRPMKLLDAIREALVSGSEADHS